MYTEPKPIGTQLNGVRDLGRIGKRWGREKCGFGQPGARPGTEGKAGGARRPRRRRRRRACAGRPPQPAGHPDRLPQPSNRTPGRSGSTSLNSPELADHSRHRRYVGNSQHGLCTEKAPDQKFSEYPRGRNHRRYRSRSKLSYTRFFSDGRPSYCSCNAGPDLRPGSLPVHQAGGDSSCLVDVHDAGCHGGGTCESRL